MRVPALVIFDCDGVLIDSEGLASRVVSAELDRLGWPATAEECYSLFAGLRLSDLPPIIVGRGLTVPRGWVDHLRDSLIDALAREVETVPGARAAIEAVLAMGLPVRVASNSSHDEMEVKFRRTGLASLLAGRIHSARDVARGKPAPDVFLAAAAAQNVAPSACVVIEDSLPGVRAAIAAGMTCIGLARHDDGAGLRALGAIVIRDLSELPSLIATGLRSVA